MMFSLTDAAFKNGNLMKLTLKRILLLATLLAPLQIHAHTIGGAANGWHDGFNHPLHGWDHLLVMIAVGLWAAQQRGRAVWLIPLTFVGVMSLGGIVGVTGVNLPGVEMAILISVAVFSILVARKIRLSTSLSMLVVGFFAFFHGFAHGSEMPDSVSLITFALGFILATLLLHGFGLVAGRLVALLVACAVGSSAWAQEATNAPVLNLDPVKQNETKAVKLPTVVVTGREDNLVGVADTASQGSVGQEQLKYRPIIRPGEVLETVPGLIVSQHSGEGKANQYYLRGFNLDHGTDFLTQMDGVPVNLVSHAHGQGWTDTGFLIPELVRTISYQKGVYYPENGDFSSAGAANIQYFNTLPNALVKIEGGSFNYYRGLFTSSVKVGDGNFLYALEGVHNDGPWVHGDDYRKGNAVLRYSQEQADAGWSLTAMGYKAKWNSSDQIAKRAVDSGFVDRFGQLDPTDGGNSQRYSLTAEWHRQSAESATKVMAYGYYYDLDLFSDFTYFLNNPVRGDQFEQPDKRFVSGLKASHTIFHPIGNAESESTLGLQVRNDNIRNGLFLTQNRQRYDTVRRDTVWETSVSPYIENRTSWTEWFRSDVGARFDQFRFDVNSNQRENSGTSTAGLISPKGSLAFGPWAKTELYLSGGLGFHSNDGRGVNTHVDPATGLTTDANGNLIKPAKPLARTYGAEVGARTTWLPGLQSTLAVWLLDSDSELVFSGDAGTTDISRPSRRYGVEFGNYYSPAKWITFDADLSFSHSRFTEEVPIGDYIPGSVESVIAAGVTVHDLRGFFGGLRLRFFGPRPLIEDNSVRSQATLLLTADVGYEINKTWTIQGEVFNLLNRQDSAIDYYYASRLPGEPSAGVNDVHFHPVEPISFRVVFSAKF